MTLRDTWNLGLRSAADAPRLSIPNVMRDYVQPCEGLATELDLMASCGGPAGQFAGINLGDRTLSPRSLRATAMAFGSSCHVHG
jgi:hypothetical protein